MAKQIKAKAKVKGTRFTKQGLANIAKAAKKQRGSKNHNYNKLKSRDGIKSATQKDRDKYLASERDHEYPAPWFLRPNEIKIGKPKAFQSPKHLYDAIGEYFTWCEDNPWYKSEWKDKGLQKIPVKRVFTWEGLCLRLGVNGEYFRNFIKQLKPDDPELMAYSWVVEWARKIIYTNKFEGASANLYNANLIAYDLGLRKDVAINAQATGTIINVQSQDQAGLIEEVKKRLNEIDEQQQDQLTQ